MRNMMLNACLVLLLVAAVSVQYSQGSFGSACTTDSDCDYDHGYCYKFDQCAKGVCKCQLGYGGEDDCSKTMKKIGETCNGNNLCYQFTSCKDGTCKCDNNKPASKNKMNCGLLNGEECNTGSDCINGLCSDSKCVCESSKKNYIYGELYGYGRTGTLCVPKDAIVNIKVGQPCGVAGTCESGLLCGQCPVTSTTMKCVSGPQLWVEPTVEPSNPTSTTKASNPPSIVKPTNSSGSNSTAVDIRLKGASQLSVGLLALGGLIVTAVLTKFV